MFDQKYPYTYILFPAIPRFFDLFHLFSILHASYFFFFPLDCCWFVVFFAFPSEGRSGRNVTESQLGDFAQRGQNHSVYQADGKRE